MFEMTSKEIIELRLKCLAPYVATGSKVGLEKNDVIRCAEEAWEYAIKPLEESKEELPEKPTPDGT